MKKTYTAKQSIVINAPAARVWEALTRPELVKQYLFGTEMTADWRVGGAISYRGQWEGKTYEDKGSVKIFEPERLLQTTYFSASSGLEDRPENYHTVTSADHSAGNWGMVLEALRKLLEK